MASIPGGIGAETILMSRHAHGKKLLGPGVDSAGSVFIRGGNVYREVSGESLKPLHAIMSDKRYRDHLVKTGMVETAPAHPARTAGQLLLRHRKIDFVSYYLEWSFDMLKDAALVTLRLTKELGARGMVLKDAHPYNVLFDYLRPTFVDVSSIVAGPLRDSWSRGFWGEFVVPLLLMKNGTRKLQSKYFYWENVPSQKIRLTRVLFHPRLLRFVGLLNSGRTDRYLDRLEGMVSRMTLGRYHTRWEDYYSRDGFQEQAALSDKERSALLLLEKLRKRGQKTMVDIASNEGWFALSAAKMGYNVVAFDYDERAINNLYRKHRGSGQHILPLVMDFRRPTEPHGLKNVWAPAIERLKCDVSLSMAIIHHLVLTQNVTFDEFRDRLSDFTRNFAIVEFIGRDDVHIQKWLRGKEWYNEGQFLDSMARRFDLVDSLPSNLPTRKVLLFKTKE